VQKLRAWFGGASDVPAFLRRAAWHGVCSWDGAQAATLRDGEGLPRFVEQAAFARRAPASLAEALAEAGVSRVPALRLSGPSTMLRAIPSRVEGWRAASPVFDVPHPARERRPL
jgi:hypothetical protein